MTVRNIPIENRSSRHYIIVFSVFNFMRMGIIEDDFHQIFHTEDDNRKVSRRARTDDKIVKVIWRQKINE